MKRSSRAGSCLLANHLLSIRLFPPTTLHHSTGSADNPYHPFNSRFEWEVARWAKLRGSGSTAFLDLLAITGVAEKLELSFKNSRELNRIIDKELPPARPRFQRHEIIVAGESFEVYFRDILECTRSLYGDPEFAPLLLLVPEKHFTDKQESLRVYFDMNTGKWWWVTQNALEWDCPGATVIPVIISSDKMQLTQFGNKSAYPVYMTIGNLPKDIRCKPSRRGQILIAYLPTSRLLHIKNKAARRRTLANLFHACMGRITQPLVTAGLHGIALTSSDGVVRHGHLILAVLVTGCKTGNCPKCPTDKASMDILDALATIEEGPRAYTAACREAGIKPLYHPFWESLPYTNIFYAITPDVLHQLYQGVMKHLVAWLKKAFGDEELDARVRRLPQNNSLRHFAKGISKLTRVTGKEHRDMCRILIGLIIGLPLPHGLSPSRLVRAVRALLDFLYYAQFTCHTTETLCRLSDALKLFHANKLIFVDLGIREHFHFPKLHSLDHYPRSIELFEKIERHEKYIAWHLERGTAAVHPAALHSSHVSGCPRNPPSDLKVRIQMTRHPSVYSVKFADVTTKYGATHFRDALARFVVQQNHPDLSAHEVERRSARVYFPFSSVSVFHKIKINIPDVQGLGLQQSNTRDVVHIRPARKNIYHNTVPDFRVVQVRMVFKLPDKGAAALFPSLPQSARQRHLAYVHWFLLSRACYAVESPPAHLPVELWIEAHVVIAG
ncbi:hypothetical protein BD414DRAFT_518074 [Trametes punicea]|nr:hypothetical protein BD414DRAFT_518074 [Trametes punicea]